MWVMFDDIFDAVQTIYEICHMWWGLFFITGSLPIKKSDNLKQYLKRIGNCEHFRSKKWQESSIWVLQNTAYTSNFNFAGCARIYPWTTSTAVWIWTWRTQWTTCSRARSWSPPGTRSTPTLGTTDKCCRWAISSFCTYFPNFSAHFRFQLFFHVFSAQYP